MVQSGTLFVIDCLRQDGFPERYQPVTRFRSALNTPLYFTSLMQGRNMLGTVPWTREDMFNLYYDKPNGPTLFTELKTRGVHCYLHSDEPLVRRGWWKHHAASYPRPMEKPWFLLWHTFHAHAAQGHTGNQAMRSRHFRQYRRRISRCFSVVDGVRRREKPERYIVMGDHGEEFHEDVEGDAMWGHGTFTQPILTDNVRYTGLHCNNYASDVHNNRYYCFPETFHELYKEILSWYPTLS